MAYGEKYRGEFYNANNEICRVDICQDGYTGAIVDIIFGDTPVVRKLDSSNKPIYDWIKTTSLEINLKKEYFTQYEEFLNTDDKKYLVRLYENSVQTFSGWLITSGITEPYRSVPYIISLQAVDGLNRLKDVDFTTPQEIYTRQFYGAEYYKAWRVSFREIFTQILTNLPPDYILRSYSGIFAWDGTTGYNLFNAKTYINYELLKGKNLYEIIEMINTGFGYKVIIDRAIIRIFGLKEQEEWAYGNDTDYTDYNSVFEVIDTDSETCGFLTIGNELTLLTGGNITKKPAYKEVKVDVDYGRLDNILIPGNLENSVVLDENNIATIYFWRKLGSNDFKVKFVEDTKDKYLEYYFGAALEPDIIKTQYLVLDFKLKDQEIWTTENSRFKLKFDVRKKPDSVTGTFRWAVLNSNLDDATIIFLDKYFNNLWGWSATSDHDFFDLSKSLTLTDEWKTIDIDIEYLANLPQNDFKVLFFIAYETPYVSAVAQIKNVQLSLSNYEDGNKILYPKNELVTVVNNINGLFSSETVKTLLATPPTTYNGSVIFNTMAVYKSVVVIETASEQFITVSDTYHQLTDMTYDPLQDYVGRLVASSATISQSVVTCDLKGYLSSWLCPIYNIEEPSKMYFIGSGSYDVKRMRGSYELLQYVAYVGFDWSNIITEDNNIVETEDAIATLITEVNLN